MLSFLFFLSWIVQSIITYTGKSLLDKIVLVLFEGYEVAKIKDSNGDFRKRGMLLRGALILFLSLMSSPDDLGFIISTTAPIVLMLVAVAKPKFIRSLVGASLMWVATAPAIVTLFQQDFTRFSINDVICYSVSGGVLTSLLMLRPKSDCDSSSSILMMFINLVAIIHSICGLFIASLGSRGMFVCGIIMSVDALVTVGYTMPQKVSPQVISLLKGILVPSFGIVSLSVNQWYAGFRYTGVVACFIFGIGVHHIAAVFFTDLWFRLMSTVTTEDLAEHKEIAIKMSGNCHLYSNVNNEGNEDLTVISSELNEDDQVRDSVSEGHTEIQISNPMSEITLSASPNTRMSLTEQQSDPEPEVEVKNEVQPKSSTQQTGLFSGLVAGGTPSCEVLTNGTFFSESTASVDPVEGSDQLATEDALLLAVKRLQAPPSAKQKRNAKRQQNLKQTFFDIFNSMSPDGSPLTLSVLNKAVDDVDIAGSILDQADTDSDGRVSLGEWISYINKYLLDHNMTLDNVTPEVLQSFCAIFNYDCSKSTKSVNEATKKKKKKRTSMKLSI
eukprot:TRINITY_DN2343_c1_g1_i8.p1 TRINITY_DN2343_c1_g1~~TRINITY_DN2343_c1_g1_i8.p1  ORF type:complete len:556 (+),score=105.33 TRINITY_DN2343_c1_g1_i8:54-1721(+)